MMINGADHLIGWIGTINQGTIPMGCIESSLIGQHPKFRHQTFTSRQDEPLLSLIAQEARKKLATRRQVGLGPWLKENIVVSAVKHGG